MALLNLASFVLILPGCGLACVVLGFYVLTTIPLGTVLWNLFVALAWLPVVVAAFVGVVLALIMLLVRFPLLVPVLVSVLGFGSIALLALAADLWWKDAEWMGWVVITLDLAGVAMAAARVWRARCVDGE